MNIAWAAFVGNSSEEEALLDFINGGSFAELKKWTYNKAAKKELSRMSTRKVEDLRVLAKKAVRRLKLL